jgi:hypothetical protein
MSNAQQTQLVAGALTLDLCLLQNWGVSGHMMKIPFPLLRVQK